MDNIDISMDNIDISIVYINISIDSISMDNIGDAHIDIYTPIDYSIITFFITDIDSVYLFGSVVSTGAEGSAVAVIMEGTRYARHIT